MAAFDGLVKIELLFYTYYVRVIEYERQGPVVVVTGWVGYPALPGLSLFAWKVLLLSGWRGAMADNRFGKLAEDALATLRKLPDVRELPQGIGWGAVQSFEGWSAQRALGLRLVERGGSVEDVRPNPY